jgi:UDP-glucose 4-epimerase
MTEPAMSDQIARAFSGRRVLVTGGAGFVGGALVRRLADADAKVTVLDDLFTGRPDTVPTSAQLVTGSVVDEDLVRSLVADSSVVFHMAARNIIASTKDPRQDFATNIGGTLNVLLAARDSKVDRVVYTGSTSIYGNPRTIPINEDDPPVVLSPYAVSKLGGELYCNAFYENFGVPVSVVRYSNVFGIGQRPDNPYCGVIGKFFASAMEGKPLQIHGDGAQTRDYTYIDDAVDATLLAAIRPRAEGEMFNVGTGIETSVNDLAVKIGEAVGVEVDIVHIDRRDIDNIRRRGRQHREGPPDAPLGTPGDADQRPRPDRRLDALDRLRRDPRSRGEARLARRGPAGRVGAPVEVDVDERPGHEIEPVLLPANEQRARRRLGHTGRNAAGPEPGPPPAIGRRRLDRRPQVRRRRRVRADPLEARVDRIRVQARGDESLAATPTRDVERQRVRRQRDRQDALQGEDRQRREHRGPEDGAPT